ncbi:hypothetical protein Hamer_G012416 [Homarus americanus]|uniref:Uncharacterized protein n=1 Tax=Homarus americanus TaxID=6706 RepID=A0A8J5N0L5_HOMAM|nr:hypothetical protein Hamer_G012416 [Homarus americanus]
MEKLKLEFEFKKMQLEAEREKIQADKEVELRKLEVEERTGIRRGNGDKDNKGCNLPEFVEEEAEDVFIQFEKVATIKKWDKSDWAILV